MSHEIVERKLGLLMVLIVLVISVGGLVEIVPLALSAAAKQGNVAYHASHRAAAGGIRHLRARGLLSVPLADDSAVPQRDRALRTLLGGRGIAVRPSLRVRLQAYRSGSGPRWRTLQRRLASRTPAQPARRRARIEHARIPVAGNRARSMGSCWRAKLRVLRMLGTPYTDEQIAGAAGRSRRQD